MSFILKYRSDIDGLRAIAVMSVVAYHSGISTFSGGYVGVDVFFVISGYLITSLIYKEIQQNRFTFSNFYKRRAARLLPTLSITLLGVLMFGFVFYNNNTFDNLGKELFFSSFGAANILFAQGVNYFAKEEAYQPLIHLWSLGVEEQFYIVWPVLLMFAFRCSNKLIFPIALILFFVSLILSIISVEQQLTEGYFLLHYRAFELLIGVITALLLARPIKYNIKFIDFHKQMFTYIGLALIVIPMFVLDKHSSFPGYNALWPCLGTALIIAFPNRGTVTKTLSYKPFVFIGLISYPLYLYHQPIISFIHFFEVNFKPLEMFAFVSALSIFASWVTYKFIEIPIRNLAHSKHSKTSAITIVSLSFTIPLFAVIGLFIAKSNGFEERFKYLNPFALEISRAHSTTFHHNFERGYQVDKAKHGKALFVGDSVLQHYVLPIKLALNIDNMQVDTVTRGGCALLKNTNFKDSFSDISCDNIRSKLYSSEKTYDFVIISQAWESYDSSVLNFSDNSDKYERWFDLLDETVKHFLNLSDKVIIIGAHLSVEGTNRLQPSVTVTRDAFLSNLDKLEIKNVASLQQSHDFFSKFEEKNRVQIIEPYRVFCLEQCKIKNTNWSYFSDNLHVSNAATSFIKDRVASILEVKTRHQIK